MHVDSTKINMLPVNLQMSLDHCSAHTPLGDKHIPIPHGLSISMLVYWHHNFHFCIILVCIGSGYDDPKSVI